MPMQAVLLTRFEAVDVAVKMGGLPHPSPHKPV
jgi:hypothetical protein